MWHLSFAPLSSLHHQPLNSLWVCIKPSQKTFVVNKKKKKSCADLKNNLTEKEGCHQRLGGRGWGGESRMDRWQTSHTWMKWRDGRKDCKELMVDKADGQRKLRKEKTRGKIQKHAALKTTIYYKKKSIKLTCRFRTYTLYTHI